MDNKQNEIQEIIRNTLEYHEARALVAQRDALRTELKRINAELKQVQRLSPEAVELAKTDS